MQKQLKQVYLVGGAVRDALLNIESKDDDYVVVGETIEHMMALGYLRVGSDFPVFLHPQTKDEYALARTERKSGKGYTGFSVDASRSVTLDEDLARRDLTINSMAQDAAGNIIDPFNGRQDLANKILRHTTQAFAEDPVRVLRVARFLARYGDQWTIHPDTQRLIEQLRDSGELQHLVAERVWQETEKALTEKFPHLYFIALNTLGIFPEIEQMVGIPQPQEHHPEGDVFNHTMLVLKRAADLGYDLDTRFAALTHDFGKATSYLTRGNLHGHEQTGVAIVKAFCERLKVPNRLRELAMLASDNHTHCHRIFELKPATLHRLIIKKMNATVHPTRFKQFIQTCICDAQGRGETLVNKAYPQAEFALNLFDKLMKLDKKKVVKEAIARGEKGPDIGRAISVAEKTCVAQFVKEYSSKNAL